MNKSAAYILGGHGCEIIDEFGKRSILPQGVTIITFAPCGIETNADDDSWMFDRNRASLKEVRDLYEYPFVDDHLTKLKETHKNIRVYPPGSLIPNLRFFPFSSWELSHSHWETIPEEEDGLLVSLSGIIPLFETKDPNPKWKDLHDESAEEAALESGVRGAWCYTSTPEKDADAVEDFEEDERDSEEAISKIIQPHDVILEFPHGQFQEKLIDKRKTEWISYTELLLGDDYREYKLTGEIPDYLYRYIYQHSIYRPYSTLGFNPDKYSLDIPEVIEMCQRHARTKNIVLYWNVCRSLCEGETKETKAMLPLIRSKSDTQQQGISNFFQGPAPAPAAPAAATAAAAAAASAAEIAAGAPAVAEGQSFWDMFGKARKRRKTYRKNLRKSHKSKKKWTRTKHSRSRRS